MNNKPYKLLDEQKRTRLLDAIRLGSFIEHACAYAGITSRTYRKWRELAEDDVTLLEAIGRTRGCLRSGGRVDLERAAKILLTELRAGTLGKITLETPEMMEKELLEVAKIREQQAAKKAAKQHEKAGSRD